MELILVIIIGVIIWAYTSAKKTEREQSEQSKRRNREYYIKRTYPHAYNEYWEKPIPPASGYYGRYYSSYHVRRANGDSSDAEWENLEKLVLAQMESRRQLDLDKQWETNQNAFAADERKKSGELMPTFGHYTYSIDIETLSKKKVKLKIWQHFTFAACQESDLDYTYQQVVKNNSQNILTYRKNGFKLDEEYRNSILRFLTEIGKTKTIMVLYNTNIKHWEKDAAMKTYNESFPSDSFTMLAYQCKKWYFGDLWAGDLESAAKSLVKDEPLDRVVILDACTTNDELVENCKHAFTQLRSLRPQLTYISFNKYYNKVEMESLIAQATKDAEKRKEDERVKEEERKRREAEELAERQRKAAERKRLQATAKQVLIANSHDWELLYGDFHYTWLLYYYPITCEFEASESEWDDRYTIWNFKNDPEKGISSVNHDATLDYVIPEIKQKLVDTFGAEYLQFITLVCLPASTSAKNVARYEEFSRRLCEETEMENAFEHIFIVKDGMSKKHPNNHSGRSIQPVVEYEKDYFKGRYVLLFDDVVTKGDTMLKYKEEMEKEGAFVIGGFCLGKTKHERPFQTRILNPSVQSVFPPVSNTFNVDSELPF